MNQRAAKKQSKNTEIESSEIEFDESGKPVVKQSQSKQKTRKPRERGAVVGGSKTTHAGIIYRGREFASNEELQAFIKEEMAEQTREPDAIEELTSQKSLPPVAATFPQNEKLPATKLKPQLPATEDASDTVAEWLDETDPSGLAGRLIKFAKEGHFITTDDGEPVPEDQTFIFLGDETVVGWLRWNDEGVVPTRIMGLLYGGFRKPPRQSLGDNDPNEWEVWGDGAPRDPWQEAVNLVLQSPETDDLFTFATSSVTGVKACARLIRQYVPMVKRNELPVIKLKAGGFNHPKRGVGWVPVPVFTVVDRVPRASGMSSGAATEDKDFDDEIKF